MPLTWTYDGDFSTARDRVRLLVGDTDVADKLIYDQEIANFTVGGAQAQADDYLIAAACADVIASKFARQVQSINAGGSSVVFDIAQGRAKFFRDMAKDLRTKSATSTARGPFIGGISRSDRTARESDPDRVSPAFTRTTGDAFGDRMDSCRDYQ